MKKINEKFLIYFLIYTNILQSIFCKNDWLYDVMNTLFFININKLAMKNKLIIF